MRETWIELTPDQRQDHDLEFAYRHAKLTVSFDPYRDFETHDAGMRAREELYYVYTSYKLPYNIYNRIDRRLNDNDVFVLYLNIFDDLIEVVVQLT